MKELKAAVFGSGEMGSKIASLFAIQKIPVLLFDLTRDLVKANIKKALSASPIPSLPNAQYAKWLTPLSSQDSKDLEKLKTIDLIIEAIPEKLNLKQELFNRLLPFLKEKAVIASNTSGLTVQDITSGMPEKFRRRFSIWHFFNPPLILPLVELVRGEKTDPDAIAVSKKILKEILCRNVMEVKDTPNFLANKIGLQALLAVMEAAHNFQIPISHADKLTGELIGRSSQGPYQLADSVGIDVIYDVLRNYCRKATDDTEIRIPKIIEWLYDHKCFGQKTSHQGFYLKIEQEGKKADYLEFDLNTLQYIPKPDFKSEAYRGAKKNFQTLEEQTRCLSYHNSPHGKFIWTAITSNLIYCSQHLSEAADCIIDADNAMKWGYNWKLGPFEVWDALGLKKSIARLESEGKRPAPWIYEMTQNGFERFYADIDGCRHYYDLRSKSYQKCPESSIPALKNKNAPIIKTNWGTRLIDLKDGIACLELRSIWDTDHNPIDDSAMDALRDVHEVIKAKGFKGLVIASSGEHFSLGANLKLIAELIHQKDWRKLEQTIISFQKANLGLYSAPFPVVSAIHHMTLGGGYEIARACRRIISLNLLFCGMVEAGVGLVPAGCGCLWTLFNHLDGKRALFNPTPLINAFKSVANPKPTKTAYEAKSAKYLRDDDIIVMNQNLLISAAKEHALDLSQHFTGRNPNLSLPISSVCRKAARIVLNNSVDSFLAKKKISEHDAKIGRHLINIFTGSNKSGHLMPQDILDLEREAFLSLSGEPKTLERIDYMLQNKKPLRN